MDNNKLRALVFMVMFMILGLAIGFMENQTTLTYILYFVCFFLVGWNLSILITRKRG